MDIHISDKGKFKNRQCVAVRFVQEPDYLEAFLNKNSQFTVAGGTVWVEKSLSVDFTDTKLHSLIANAFSVAASYNEARDQIVDMELDANRLQAHKLRNQLDIRLGELRIEMQNNMKFCAPEKERPNLVTWLRNFNWTTGRANS